MMRRKLTEKLSRPGITFSRFPLSAWLSMAVLAIIVLACLFAPLITQYTPLEQAVGTAGPSAGHWFGQDSLGRDLFSRLLYGGRWSLTIGLGSTFLALCAGALIGSVAATSRKGVDETIMRVLDVVMAFPGIALAAVLVAAFGGSIPVLIVTIAFLYTPMVARVVRANVLAQYGEDYVAAEKVIGARTSHIVVKHVVANCAAPVLVFCTVMVADASCSRPACRSSEQVCVPPRTVVGIGDRRRQEHGPSRWLVGNGVPPRSADSSDGAIPQRARRGPDGRDGRSESEEDQEDALRTPSSADRRSGGDLQRTHSGGRSRIGRQHSGVDRRLRRPERRERCPETGRRADSSRNSPEDPGGNRAISVRSSCVRGDAAPLLEVRNLTIRFPERYGDTAIVDNVSFTVRPNETMALVGESGCGKSLTSLAIMGLLPKTQW